MYLIPFIVCVFVTQDTVLDFFPGPIQAVDGDEGLRTPIKYTILSGASPSSATEPYTNSWKKNLVLIIYIYTVCVFAVIQGQIMADSSLTVILER